MSLALLAIPALRADVTLRYKTVVTLNPALPQQIAQQAIEGMDASVPKETSLELRNGKGFSSMTGASSMVSICDFTKQQITLLDQQGKRYATLSSAQFADELARAIPEMPEPANAMMAAMKTQFESKATGRTATIAGVEGEEREIVMTVEAPAAPNVPSGPMLRLVMHLWTARSSETLRIPAIRELAGYNLFAAATMNRWHRSRRHFGKCRDSATTSAPCTRKCSPAARRSCSVSKWRCLCR